MKSLMMKISAVLLVLWYCLSIIGFDVHSCTVTGSTFVNSVLSGVECEDVHPKHDCCCHGSCCSSGCNHDHNTPAKENVSKKECCTNEIEVLDSEVVVSVEDDGFDLSVANFAFVENDYVPLIYAQEASVSENPDSGNLRRPDIQAVLSIWRI